MADYKQGRRRSYSMEYEDEYEDSGLRLIRKSGIPLLYILGCCSNLIGIICLGIITNYWSNIDTPTCFLYSQTASFSQVYTFGSSLSNCYWVTYGPILPTLLAMFCGIFYMYGVFGDPVDRKEEDLQVRNTRFLTLAMAISTVLLLAVCCTLAEGIRITCTNMGLNAVNGKAANCMDKLNLRVAQYQLPVETSTMVTAGTVGLWIGLISFTMLVICHLLAMCRMR